MFSKIIGYSIVGLVIVLHYSCQKNITVAPPPYTNKVSIQCFIEADSIPILYFNKTVGYFDGAIKRSQLVIRDAFIKIEGSTVSDTLTIDSVFDRLDCQYNYFYKGNKTIFNNATYNLVIISAVDTYRATASTDIIPCTIDSVAYTSKFSDINGEHEGVIVYFKDNSLKDNFYRYELVRFIDTATKKAEQPIVSSCLGKDSMQTNEIGRAVLTNIGLEGQQLKIVVEPAYSHKAGTSGYIYMQAIDKNVYDFFNQLDQQKLAANNPFVEPVFIKPGQFGSKAIGFFSAKKNSLPHLFIYPE
jgi:hypothetical protein